MSFQNNVNKFHRKRFCANLATQTLCIVAICVFNYTNTKLLQVQMAAAVWLVGALWQQQKHRMSKHTIYTLSMMYFVFKGMLARKLSRLRQTNPYFAYFVQNTWTNWILNPSIGQTRKNHVGIYTVLQKIAPHNNFMQIIT